MYATLLILLHVASGIAAGWDARRKGYHDWLFLVLGVVIGPLFLIVMWFLTPKALQIGTPVKPVAKVTLDSGAVIPASHVTVVRDVTVIDGAIVCLVTAPGGSKHWVAQEALTRVGRPEPT